MFDKLIVSEPEGAEFKSRRSYFMVSSVVVGILFGTAVVVSIFAAEVGLGTSGLELVEMIAPPEMIKVEPDIAKPQQPTRQNELQSDVPTRTSNTQRMEESPHSIPTTASTTPSTEMSRPKGYFTTGTLNTDPVNHGGGVGRVTEPTGPGTSLSTNQPEPEPERDVEPPTTPKVVQPVRTISGGVVNGNAKHLPPPPYPPAARAVGIAGKVDVQVLIDESGNVVSAHAVSGHTLLRAAAERAAKNARFSPTLLSRVPVKVTGVIVYNFAK